ncbi:MULTISPECIES: hypothetical protein [unclassified Microbacterium]|nr:hypothetical protein [Microbacterium sp. MAH-37]
MDITDDSPQVGPADVDEDALGDFVALAGESGSTDELRTKPE